MAPNQMFEFTLQETYLAKGGKDISTKLEDSCQAVLLPYLVLTSCRRCPQSCHRESVQPAESNYSIRWLCSCLEEGLWWSRVHRRPAGRWPGSPDPQCRRYSDCQCCRRDQERSCQWAATGPLCRDTGQKYELLDMQSVRLHCTFRSCRRKPTLHSSDRSVAPLCRHFHWGNCWGFRWVYCPHRIETVYSTRRLRWLFPSRHCNLLESAGLQWPEKVERCATS